MRTLATVGMWHNRDQSFNEVSSMNPIQTQENIYRLPSRNRCIIEARIASRQCLIADTCALIAWSMLGV
jgi:hypothetical protein